MVTAVRNADGARIVVDSLRGPGRDAIAAHGVDRFGELLFRPVAGGGSDG